MDSSSFALLCSFRVGHEDEANETELSTASSHGVPLSGDSENLSLHAARKVAAKANRRLRNLAPVTLDWGWESLSSFSRGLLAYNLWCVVFKTTATVLLFSTSSSSPIVLSLLLVKSCLLWICSAIAMVSVIQLTKYFCSVKSSHERSQYITRLNKQRQ